MVTSSLSTGISRLPTRDPVAQVNLGLMYEHGRGRLARSEVKAAYWYQKVARQGNAAARARLKSRGLR